MNELVSVPIGRDTYNELESALALVKPSAVLRGMSYIAHPGEKHMYAVLADGVPARFEGIWKSTIPFTSLKEMNAIVEAIEFANPAAVVARKNGYVLVFCDTTVLG